MDEGNGVEKVLFDLSSESRLGILYTLQKQQLKMQDLARALDLTATETFRQLERLSGASMVVKQPDGTFTITHYGVLTLQTVGYLQFVSKNKEYFLSHDVQRLPYQFVNRLGELRQATLETNIAESMNKAGHMVAEAEKYFWAIGDRAFESVGGIMAEQLKQGVKFRFMFQESLLSVYKKLPEENKNVEKRTLQAVPAILVCTDKEAALCLPLADGKIDYTGFFSKDPMFMNWANELFLYYWNQAKHV